MGRQNTSLGKRPLNIQVTQESFDAMQEIATRKGKTYTDLVSQSLLLLKNADAVTSRGGQIVLREQDGRETSLQII